MAKSPEQRLSDRFNRITAGLLTGQLTHEAALREITLALRSATHVPLAATAVALSERTGEPMLLVNDDGLETLPAAVERLTSAQNALGDWARMNGDPHLDHAWQRATVEKWMDRRPRDTYQRWADEHASRLLTRRLSRTPKTEPLEPFGPHPWDEEAVKLGLEPFPEWEANLLPLRTRNKAVAWDQHFIALMRGELIFSLKPRDDDWREWGELWHRAADSRKARGLPETQEMTVVDGLDPNHEYVFEIEAPLEITDIRKMEVPEVVAKTLAQMVR